MSTTLGLLATLELGECELGWNATTGMKEFVSHASTRPDISEEMNIPVSLGNHFTCVRLNLWPEGIIVELI